jgi:Phosphomethylpyrimidine kinase
VEYQCPAEVTQRYGVHRARIYKLEADYEGEAALRPRSRRPKSSPTAPPPAVELGLRLRRQLAKAGLNAGDDTIGWHPAGHHRATLRRQATALQELGAPRVLIRGGHRQDDMEAVDLLLDVDGERLLRPPRVDTLNTHGTGCTLSSALAALPPQRDSWLEAAMDAKTWLTEALAAAHFLAIGHGHGPARHFHEIWDH